MQLEQQVQEVEQFFQFTDVQHNDGKNKGREKPHTGSKKPMQRVSGREATALEEMQEDIMRPFTKILNEASTSISAIIFISNVYNCWIKIDSCI